MINNFDVFIPVDIILYFFSLVLCLSADKHGQREIDKFYAILRNRIISIKLEDYFNFLEKSNEKKLNISVSDSYES